MGFWNPLSHPPLLPHQELQLSSIITVSCIGVVWFPGLQGRLGQRESCRTTGESEKGSNWGISTPSPLPQHLLQPLPRLPAPLVLLPLLPQPHGQPWPVPSRLLGAQLLALAKLPFPTVLPAKKSKSIFSCSGSLLSPPPLGSQFPLSNSLGLKDLQWFLFSDWAQTNTQSISQLKGDLCSLVSFLFLCAQLQGRLQGGSYYTKLQTIKKLEGKLYCPKSWIKATCFRGAKGTIFFF